MSYKNIRKLADSVGAVETSNNIPETAVRSAKIAARILERALEIQSPEDQRRQRSLARLVKSPHDKITIMKLTDQGFRSSNPHRVANQMVYLLNTQSIPGYMASLDKTLLEIFRTFGRLMPGIAMPLVKKKMRSTSENLILAAEPEPLRRHLEARQNEGIRMNVNFLGEAVLGEEEASRRMEEYLRALAKPEVEVVSVKISTIYSQISPIAAEYTIEVLCDRLEKLFSESQKHTFSRSDGTSVPKFVYLDMEEYRDMFLTAEAFMRTLERPGLKNVQAGIALQAYIPDSFLTQKRINEWARKRVEAGGAPITIRIVKGANLEMEKVEAAIKGWPQAPYKIKKESDANFKRMLHEALLPENIAAVRLGVASHNLFDTVYGLLLSSEKECEKFVQFEMLEGMADHICQAFQDLADDILLYAPATRSEDFISAIGYLVRRLDENTGPKNFLSNSFDLEPGGRKWRKLENEFLESFELIETLEKNPRRKQDRSIAVDEIAVKERVSGKFENEPDTDFSLPDNQQWASEIVDRWKLVCGDRVIEIPLVIDGEEIFDGRKTGESLDPSRPEVAVGSYRNGTGDDAVRAIACAKDDPDGWREKSIAERMSILSAVAKELRESRADLMGAAMADGGKTLLESDPEISEAIDFLEYYPRTVKDFEAMPNIETEGKGVVVVVSPWNFPIAIPSGGISAALAAGNTVILKPASDTVLVAYELCKCYWRAGVTKRTLQFLPCPGSSAGSKLVQHEDVDAVILTGGTETALKMLKKNPAMNLFAETGGKNATIVTAMSDRDQAIKHVIQSAFGHGGQKCSATSLLVLEEEVFEDEKFKRQLKDAVGSMNVGSAWELQNRIGPLIKPPEGHLKKAMEELEDGESWLIEPGGAEENPCIQRPAIKWDVKPGSFCHTTELFGPVLSVMKASNLEHAIGIVNSTGYGLTSGIESLDDREINLWMDRIKAGNLYVNRVTTGAIVLRQPFGGMGKSAFGPGMKAGGPNYTALLINFKEIDLPDGNKPVTDAQMERLIQAMLEAGKEGRMLLWQVEKIIATIRSCDSAAMEEFFTMHDHFHLRGQDNIRKYLPVARMMVRIEPEDSVFEILARICAARTVCRHFTVSYSEEHEIADLELTRELTAEWGDAVEFREIADDELAQMIFEAQIDRIRYAAPDRVPAPILAAAAETGVFVARSPVLMEGRVELLWYIMEQSRSIDYHRYGNIGARSETSCAPIL